PGLVELWKPFALEDSEEGEEGEEGWLDADARAYADELAGQVRAWLDEAPVLDSTKRPLTAGDILILVRSRGELASLIVARLFAAAHAALGDLLAMADYTTPSRFLETILSGPMDGRRKLYRRLGLAARDPIDELMGAALEFERDEVPSLERFHAWFARGEVEIQRDPSERANAVRVMTVHGAKGLEAPYVILADATADPANLGR